MVTSGTGRDAMVLAERAWPDAGDGILVVPLGACEQHGAHLPFGTDTMVADALARRVTSARRDAVVAPALPYGASGEHVGFAGTLSIGVDALRTVIVELVRSADAFAGVVLVSAHGGNSLAVSDAVSLLESEGRRVLAWSPSAASAAEAAGRPADTHAGFVETSAILAIDAGLVRTGRAAAGDTRPLSAILPALRAGGVAAVAPNGVLGDPAGATAAAGGKILDAWTTDLLAAVDSWSPRPASGPSPAGSTPVAGGAR